MSVRALDRRAHGPGLPAPALRLRRDPQVFPSRPRPPDRGARSAAGRQRPRDRLRHRPEPRRSRRERIPTLATTASTSRRKCSPPLAPTLRARAFRRRSPSRRGDAAFFDAASPLRPPVFRPRLLLLQPVDDPPLARGPRSCGPLRGAGRTPARRRFRPAGTSAGLRSAGFSSPGSTASTSARAPSSKRPPRLSPRSMARARGSARSIEAMPGTSSWRADLRTHWRAQFNSTPSCHRSSARPKGRRAAAR